MTKDGHVWEWVPVADDAGRIVGKCYARSHLARAQVEVIKEFLIRIDKGKKEMIKKDEENPKVNMLYIAGILRFDPKRYDASASALVDTGQKQAVPIGAHRSNDGILKKLLRFRKGDYIKAVCTVEPFGVKQADGSWRNGLAIRITDIKTEPPQREEIDQDMNAPDDQIPF